MTRNELKKLSAIRVKEAKILLDKRQYSGAYYLAGYSIECAIKACIARRTKKSEFPDLKVAKASWVHDLGALIKSAGLEPQLTSKMNSDVQFASYWAVVKDWSEESRYHQYKQTRLYT